MNEWVLWLGIENWRPVLTAVVLPPMPFILLILIGAGLCSRSRTGARFAVVIGCLGIWATCTTATSKVLTKWLLPPTHALTADEIRELGDGSPSAIVVMGGGHRDLATEYGVPDLLPVGLERLRYGIWLSKQTGLPILFSGGRGHGSEPGESEAEIASRIAERDFARPLRWIETTSRDTRENSLRSVAMLQGDGIVRVVVVTHGYHMPRTLDNFRRATASIAPNMGVIAAPIGLLPGGRLRALDFLPSRAGYTQVNALLHELVARLMGA